MWIFANDAFLSIVAPSPADGQGAADTLVVRGRFAGDVKKVFPDAKPFVIEHRDYHERAYVDRSLVAATLAARVEGIDYRNFKDSIERTWYHDVCLKVWRVMHDAQGARLRASRRTPRPTYGNWPA